MLYLPRCVFVIDDDPPTVDRPTGTNLTADGSGEFWCAFCGSRCTRLDDATLASLSKRSVTLWSVRSALRGPSGTDRAQATEGRQTSGGAVAVERTSGGER